MIAVIKGDIIESRKLNNQEEWLKPLKSLFTKWGNTPQEWEVVWGDSFQIEISAPEEALLRALKIKAVLRKTGSIDVRMSIGIGEKTYIGSRISESNGPAFVNAGEEFETLKKEKITLALKSPWPELNKEINLYLKLTGTIMDKWSVSSAELMEIVLNRPEATQKEIGEILGIKQNSVSGRWNRAKVDEILEVEQTYRRKVKHHLP